MIYSAPVRYFLGHRGEAVTMVVPPGNRRVSDPSQYVARCETRGRPEGRPYPRSQQTIREIFGLVGRLLSMAVGCRQESLPNNA